MAMKIRSRNNATDPTQVALYTKVSAANARKIRAAAGKSSVTLGAIIDRRCGHGARERSMILDVDPGLSGALDLVAFKLNLYNINLQFISQVKTKPFQPHVLSH